MTGTPSNFPMYQPGPDLDDEIEFSDLVGILIENRWLIVAAVCLAFVIGAYKAFTAPPVYQADGLLQIEEKQSGGLSSLEAAYYFEQFTPAITEMEIIRSRSVVGEVVDRLKLDINARPEFMPYIGEALARRMPANERPSIRVDTLDLPESMRGRWFKLVAGSDGAYTLYDADDEMITRGRVGEPAMSNGLTLFVSEMIGESGQVYWVSRSPRISAVRALQGSLSVRERGDWSGILELSVQGSDPRDVAAKVDAIADVYVKQNVERRSQEAESQLEFLEQQLPVIKSEMTRAEANLNSFRLEKGSIDLPMETQTVLQTIVSIEEQINQIRQEREKVMLAFTELHPTVVALDRQIAQLNIELEELNEQLLELPDTQQELVGLIREVEVNTNLYTSLLSTAQELRVVKAGTVGNVRVVDWAVVPTSPIKPNRMMILLMSVLVGGFVGVALAFARKALHSGVEDPDVVERQINIPVYAAIPHSDRQDRLFKDLKAEKLDRAILAVDTPDDPAIESLRSLRTALHFGMIDVKNKCVMVAGPSPGVGKSFISANLATVLAGDDSQVLLIDGDLRRGHLHEYLGLGRENGLSEFISGEAPIGDVLHETAVPGLTLIPTGALPPNPAELLLHKRFTNCLSELSPRFDHIIIDSPPVLAVTDASIIGQMAGGTLLVLKSGAHPMREIEQSVKRLQQADVNLRGLLFNDITSKSRRYGAGKYHYHYSYK